MIANATTRDEVHEIDIGSGCVMGRVVTLINITTLAGGGFLRGALDHPLSFSPGVRCYEPIVISPQHVHTRSSHT